MGGRDTKLTVYFIQSADGGPVKIGKTSKSVIKRLGSLQTGSVSKLIVVGTTDRYSEKYLHERFKAWRLTGEWFKPSLILLTWIQANANITAAGHCQLARASIWTAHEKQEEVERLHRFILRLSERLFLAAECLSRIAEKKSRSASSATDEAL